MAGPVGKRTLTRRRKVVKLPGLEHAVNRVSASLRPSTPGPGASVRGGVAVALALLMAAAAEDAAELYDSDLALPPCERELTVFTALDGEPFLESTDA